MGALVWLCYLLVILTVNSYRFYGLRRTVKSINTLEAVRGNDDDMGTNRTIAGSVTHLLTRLVAYLLTFLLI